MVTSIFHWVHYYCYYLYCWCYFYSSIRKASLLTTIQVHAKKVTIATGSLWPAGEHPVLACWDCCCRTLVLPASPLELLFLSFASRDWIFLCSTDTQQWKNWKMTQEVTEQVNRINGNDYPVLGTVFRGLSFSWPPFFKQFILFISLYYYFKANK